MFANIKNFFKSRGKRLDPSKLNKDEAKERLHLVLLQDRANVSADFLEMMKQEIIEVIKKYIDIDEKEIDVKLTNKQNSDGTTGAPALYANIPIVGIKNTTRKITNKIKLEEIGNNENSKEKTEKNKSKKALVKNKAKKEEVKRVKSEEVKAEETKKAEAKVKEAKVEEVKNEKVEQQENSNKKEVVKAVKESNKAKTSNNKNSKKQTVKQK